MARILFFAELFQLLSQKIIFDVRVNFHRLYFRVSESRCKFFVFNRRSFVYHAKLARKRQDVVVARFAGISWTRIVFGHILPDVPAQMLIVATLDLRGVIIVKTRRRQPTKFARRLKNLIGLTNKFVNGYSSSCPC